MKNLIFLKTCDFCGECDAEVLY